MTPEERGRRYLRGVVEADAASGPFVLGLGAVIFLGIVAWLVTFPVSLSG